MGFQLHQKSMTLNDPERQFTAMSTVLRVLWPIYDNTMSLRHKFDENIKSDSKLLLPKQRSAFVRFANLLVE